MSQVGHYIVKDQNYTSNRIGTDMSVERQRSVQMNSSKTNFKMSSPQKSHFMNNRQMSQHGKTSSKFMTNGGLPALSSKPLQQYSNQQLPMKPRRKFQSTVQSNLSPKSSENPYASSPMKVI